MNPSLRDNVRHIIKGMSDEITRAVEDALLEIDRFTGRGSILYACTPHRPLRPLHPRQPSPLHSPSQSRSASMIEIGPNQPKLMSALVHRASRYSQRNRSLLGQRPSVFTTGHDRDARLQEAIHASPRARRDSCSSSSTQGDFSMPKRF
eukprot:TRINITY_DN69131_c0_g1_i1.p1 TRINITY_DN69131_c0_g1~~TRINITY_DN69131_c0_g1_i1.p1  ORF type:complete len:149 (-),score=2.06 TRINITY_DN69131_c0_g1_i1:22-468(-)